MIELRADGALFVRAFLAATTGILVLFAGKAINRRVALFREYNIPEPVTGGLLFALAIWAIHAVSGYEVVFEVGAFYRAQGADLPSPAFLEEVPYRFHIADAAQHYHLPFKFTDWGFSLFRGGA